jgi:predicted enzyme related to lactoylglutathione lyase
MPGGRITHVELPADDLERAKRFYAAVAGWEFQAMEGYRDYELFSTGDGTGGAIGARGTSTGTSVRIFITVPSLEAARDAAAANGGTIVEDIGEVPGQGRYAIVRDPEGSEIALWQDASGG